METLKTSETLVEGLVASKQDGLGIPVDFGEEKKCVESVSNPTGGIKGFEPVVAEIGGRIDSSSHGDVPIKGISLFVELTGGVTNDGLHHLEDRVSLGNKLDNGSLVNGNQGEVNICHQECRPNVGDFVWAIIKNQSWWPGIVCDASNPPKEASKIQNEKDGLLVRFFGNGSYVRCFPYQMKPFVAYFEQFSKQNKSKSFIGALEKAVAEFGQRIKTEFTCSCFSKKMVEGKGDIGNLSATRFQPATFVDYIKDLAKDISMSTKIDYAVNQNFLSAFYRSLGHCQMGLHQLKPASIKTEEENGVFNGDANMENKDFSFVMGDDIKNEKSEKHYETRERRKSRFLSYPYTDVNGVKRSVSGEQMMEESRLDVDGGMELKKANSQPVKKPRKKWCRKSVRKDLPTNLGSSEVLSELQSVAQDCLFPIESTKFVSAEQFIVGFRKWAFNDFTKEITIEQTAGQENGIGIGIGMGMERTIDVNTTVDMVGKGTRGRPKKVRKKNNNKPVSSPISGTNPNHGSLIIDFQNVGSPNLETQPIAANKKMEAVVPADQGLGFQNNEIKEAGSDLNSKCTILNFVDLPVNERPPCKLTPKRRKKNVANETAIHILPNVNGHMDPFLIHNLPQMNNLEGLTQPNVFHLTNELGLTPPCSTGNHGEPQIVSHEPKKRGRKRKAIDLQANPGSTVMPDLNENGAEKKRGKKGKTKETGVPCVDLSYNKVQQDNEEEVKGTAFLLKFSSDHPLPSKHDLNSIFCKFGPLNESETQVLDDSRSGQVVFLDSSSAGEAFWGLQKDNLFGQALVNYRIQHLPGAESNVGFRTPIKNPSVLKPLENVCMGSQALSSSTVLPDLNGNTSENKKSKKIEEIHLPSKVQQLGNGEATGTAILLKFSPNHPLPSNQDLNSVFCKYGKLNEFETRVSPETLNGQVVFVNPSSAGEAVQNLEKIRPFGDTLVSFRVHHLYNVQPAINIGFKKPLNVPLGSNSKQTPDLGVIKKNLEMMTMMMEKAGDTLSPEMRAKLESEIKGLMNKVSNMDGSSSSSL